MTEQRKVVYKCEVERKVLGSFINENLNVACLYSPHLEEEHFAATCGTPLWKFKSAELNIRTTS